MTANRPNIPTLDQLSLSARILITAFLLLIGAGYLAAVGNLYQRHQFADDKAGLTFDDLRANFHGVAGDAPSANSTTPDTVLPSRMLEQVRPGGEMRKELVPAGEASIRALVGWLERGARKDDFRAKGVEQSGDPSAESVIARQCLRCHNAENGEKQDTPYGPDIFDVDYDMVYVYAAPGTARGDGASAGAAETNDRIGPQSLGHLLLVSHIHMLAIPVYTLIVGGLFLLAPVPRTIRGPVAVAPMLALILDFSCWWLARAFEPAVYVIPAAGMVYGAGLAIQLAGVLAGMWLWPRSRP